MSKLFDDSSLAMIPSAVKDGKLYSIRPVPEYGDEEITNGDFATDSDWTKTNATISGGAATITSTGYAYAAIVQNNVLTIGKTYKATFNINSIIGGLIVGSSNTITNSGIASVTFTATNTYLDIRRDSSFATTTAEIDNVSVKEVLTESGDFTFSRGSNLAATRVDVNGLIEKGRENLLLQSNQFDTTWVTPDATITSGQADKDGSNNAWLLTATSAFNRVVQSVSQSGVKRFSVYAKANTNDYLLLGSFEGAHFYATFNLATGAVDSNNANVISPSIENVGNGWYRCSATWVGTTTEVRIASQATSGQGGWASTTSGSVLIQDAQLEQGLVATDYIETGASTAQAGILEDLPRLDYSGGASCPALLLEPQRSNLFTQSEYFNSTDWLKTNVTATDNSNVSPEGLQNATLINDGTAAATQHWFFQAIPLSSGTTYTISFYAKYVDRKNMFINIYDGSTSNFVFYDIQNGVVLNNDGNAVRDIVDVGNGWYRIIYTRAVVGSGANFRIGMANDAPIQTYTGENKQALVYGFQLEAGSYHTSYIPTMGSAVTRSVDSCVSSSLTTSTDFTIFFEAPNFCLINGSTGGSYDSVQFLFSADGNPYSGNGSYHIYNNTLYYYNGSTAQGFGVIYNNQTDSKFVIMKRGDKALIFANGAKKTEATLPSGGNVSIWDTINLTQSLEDGQKDVFGSTYKQLLKFDTALTDSECIALTTL